MPKGADYTIEFRRLIYHAVVHENMDEDFIMDMLTPALENPLVSIDHVRKIRHHMLRDPIWAIKYASGPRNFDRTGRPPKIGPFEKHIHLLT